MPIIRNINREDIETIRQYNIDNNKRIFGNMLKIFVFAKGNDRIITYEQLGLLLNIIQPTDIDKNGNYRIGKISYAINALRECKFEHCTEFYSKLQWFVDDINGIKKYKPKGSYITVNKEFR